MSGVQRANHFVRLTSGIRADLHLWLQFLDNHNGVTMFQDSSWSSPAITCFYTDASGSIGYGGFKDREWFSGLWPEAWGPVDIQTKEIFPIFLGVKLYGKTLANKKLKIFSDNASVVEILNKFSSKSRFVMVFVRLIVLELLTHNISIKVFHLPGFKNVVADHLSRNSLQAARKVRPSLEPLPTPVPPNLLPANWMP